jgi:hypothetical protein
MGHVAQVQKLRIAYNISVGNSSLTVALRSSDIQRALLQLAFRLHRFGVKGHKCRTIIPMFLNWWSAECGLIYACWKF